MAAIAAQPLIHQDRGELPAFASTRAIAEEEAASVDGAVGIRHQFQAALRHAIAIGKIKRCGVERVDQRFKLGAAEHTVTDHFGRKLGDVAWLRKRH